MQTSNSEFRERVVLTCAHVLRDNDRRSGVFETNSVTVSPGLTGSVTYRDLIDTVSGSNIYIPSQWGSGPLFNRAFDYALIFLNRPLGNISTGTGTFAWGALETDDIRSISEPFISGYPYNPGEGRNGDIQYFDSDVIIGSSISGPRMEHRIDTERGQSGALVFTTRVIDGVNRYVAFGLHTDRKADGETANGALRITNSIHRDIESRLR